MSWWWVSAAATWEPNFVARALEAFADQGVSLKFLANVDVHNFALIWSRIEPERTLWVIISKSYTTAETMANEDLIRRTMQDNRLDPSRHLITVTSKGSPGDREDSRGLAAFHMFDYHRRPLQCVPQRSAVCRLACTWDMNDSNAS